MTEAVLKVLNIAHRGGADLWPENTLEAFARAIELGADGIEFDLQLSGDGALIIHHDARLKPEATRHNGVFLEKPTPRLDALTQAEISAYDVGALKKGAPYSLRRPARANMNGVTIPTLAAFNQMLASQTHESFRAYAELKTDMLPVRAQSDALAAAYSEALKTTPAADRHIVISFDWRTVNKTRAAFPDMRHAYTTMGFSETDPDHKSAAQDKPDSMAARIRQASKNGAPWWDDMDWRDMDGNSHAERVLRAIQARGINGKTEWFAYWRDVTEENMAMAKDFGLRVSAWTVNEPADMREMARLGVSALITDRPDILKRL